MQHFIRSRIKSFAYAISGIKLALKSQKNTWIHTCATITVILLSFWLKLSRQDWSLIIISIGFVWTAELINTSLEATIDLATEEHHILAKLGKDVGAAAVMVSAFTSVLIGLLILGPPLWNKLFYR